MTVFKNDANLQGLWLMEEASGNREDSTQNDNTLTDNNTVESSADAKEGIRSADFEQANNEYLAIADGDQTGLDITGSLTICFWMKAEALDDGTDHTVVAKYNVTGNQRSYRVTLNLSGGNYYVRAVLSNNGTATSAAVGATALATGTWYHVGVVYNGTDIRIYLDAVLDANGANNPKVYSAGIFAGSAPFELGRLINAGRDYDGLLDEVAVFDRELSSTEISDIYNNGLQDPIHWLVNAVPLNTLVGGGLAR